MASHSRLSEWNSLFLWNVNGGYGTQKSVKMLDDRRFFIFSTPRSTMSDIIPKIIGVL